MRFKKTYLMDFLVFGFMIASFVAVEVYLHNKRPDFYKKPYQLSFYTHDGKQLWWSPTIQDWNNPESLKFVLAPYTI